MYRSAQGPSQSQHPATNALICKTLTLLRIVKNCLSPRIFWVSSLVTVTAPLATVTAPGNGTALLDIIMRHQCWDLVNTVDDQEGNMACGKNKDSPQKGKDWIMLHKLIEKAILTKSAVCNARQQYGQTSKWLPGKVDFSFSLAKVRSWSKIWNWNVFVLTVEMLINLGEEPCDLGQIMQHLWSQVSTYNDSL